ncbi:hypothetical protein Poly30_27290 [Planctomycetes bacterium Poly30]|uniref:Uncharacterized protein n=1 Tax=Saltatorellus ferox TaxID=2528018 RepID=A0A518ESY7_9BACT|nr:hypothetical protein Poly30_27290 [Planctomycetes bacterium Poly30]
MAFVLTIGAFFFLLWWLGPINLQGSKAQLGLFFVALALPICGLVWLYDPVVARLDRWFYPAATDPSEEAEQPVSAEIRERAHRLARKSRETHPISTNRATPYVFAGAAIAFFFGLNWVIYEGGLTPEYDAGAGTYIAVVVTVLASIRAYDPIVDALDRWLGQPPAA